MRRRHQSNSNSPELTGGDRYARRILDIAQPYLGRRWLGAGDGVAPLSQIGADCDRMVVVEGNPFAVARLKRQFGCRPNVDVVPGDLANAAHALRWRNERADTALCLNLLEHLERDTPALRELTAAIAPGGHVIVVVPAGESLFNELDVHEGHHRRYSSDELARKMQQAGLEIIHAELFGKLDALDWAISGYLGVRLSHFRPMAWLKSWAYTARLFDVILPVPAASLVMIGRKPARTEQRRAA